MNTNTNPKQIKSNKKNKNSFNDHMTNAWEEIYMLGELEEKYPFFRIDSPQIKYNITKNNFIMNIAYNLHLESTRNKNNIKINFGTPQNKLTVIHKISQDKLYKTRYVKAREEIRFNSDVGYNYVYGWFKRNGIVHTNKFDFYANLNDDLLHFTDHELKHRMLFGWTGGYDFKYQGGMNKIIAMATNVKNKWDAKNYLNSLETRINSLKILFDKLTNYAHFDVEQINYPVKKVPDFKKMYSDTITSDKYQFMQEFGELLSEQFKTKYHYQHNIVMSENGTEYINFTDLNNKISFYIDTDYDEGEILNVTCAVHLPKKVLKRQDFDDKYLKYKDRERYRGRPIIGKDVEMIGVYENLTLEKDIPNGFNKCLERLL